MDTLIATHPVMHTLKSPGDAKDGGYDGEDEKDDDGDRHEHDQDDDEDDFGDHDESDMMMAMVTLKLPTGLRMEP